ncbi:MAG: galactose mutarotase [Kofleriaceae bacterium]
MGTTDEIILNDADSVASIAPHRGAIATKLEIAGKRVLFMDVETLRDRSSNVRGGVPVLFPTPGKLVNDAWEYAGASGSMKQHGFARNLAWRAVEKSSASVELTLESNDETRTQFPWDFTFDMVFTLAGNSLRLEQRVTNKSATTMPYGIGFHPYFYVPDGEKATTRIATQARRAFDNVTKQTIELPASGIDLTQKEVDLHLLDHGSTESSLAWSGGTVTLRGSEAYTHWVVWTLAGRDFVCLEPWTCPGNALNTGDRLLTLAPGEKRVHSLEISFTAS